MGVVGRDRLPWILLLLAVVLGLVLRFELLGLKPLWMDEVITGIFSSGHGYEAVPLEQAVNVGAFRSIFAFAPSRCADIADRVATQSVHPPLFFCWMHGWLAMFRDGQDWVMVWRSLPALVGGLLVVVMYGLNRVAFGEKAAVGGAWVMALSPFAVYLSQEARHYTVPMVAIALGLMGMVRIQQDWQQRRVDLWVWLGLGGGEYLGVLYSLFLYFGDDRANWIAAAVGALEGWEERFMGAADDGDGDDRADLFALVCALY
jgi:uncharacterized membrane protein